MSKSHTQFCQADSYCNSATCRESRMHGSWQKSEQLWASLTTCVLTTNPKNRKWRWYSKGIGAVRWNDYEDGPEVKNVKDVKEDVDGEKTPVASRKCYNLTNHILWSKIHEAYLLPYLSYILLKICLTSAVACGFSDDRPFRYILITWSRPKFFIDWKIETSVNEHEH